MRATCVFVVASPTTSRSQIRVGKAAHEKVEHLALTSGQLGALRWGCRRCGGIAAGELLDHGTHRWWLKTAGSPIEGGRADVAYG